MVDFVAKRGGAIKNSRYGFFPYRLFWFSSYVLYANALRGAVMRGIRALLLCQALLDDFVQTGQLLFDFHCLLHLVAGTDKVMVGLVNTEVGVAC